MRHPACDVLDVRRADVPRAHVPRADGAWKWGPGTGNPEPGKLLAADGANLRVLLVFELGEVAAQLLMGDLERGGVEDARCLGLMHDAALGDPGLIDAAGLGDLRALFVGQRRLGHAGIGVPLLETLHYNLKRTLGGIGHMTILRPWAAIGALVFLALPAATATQKLSVPASWTARIEPFRVFDNVYYVGTEDLSSYLITTPQGHLLVDSGMAQNASAIAEGVQALGFKLRDVKVLLTTQAHFDHVAAHAELQKLTGAEVVASEADAHLLEGGGKGDFHFGSAYQFAPVKVGRRVTQGDLVKIGDVVLTAHMTPGHTQGTTTWSMGRRSDSNEPVSVVFVGSTAVNEGVKLVGNSAYPRIAEDFAASFARLRGLKVDVFLTAHLSTNGGLEKAAKLRAGARLNPFIDPAGYAAYLERSRRTFEAELAKQKSQ